MPTNTEVKNTTSTDLSLIRILLAESDLIEIDRIKSLIDSEFHAGIVIVKTYHQLLESVPRERPHLVVLGKIDNSNYSEISTACRRSQLQLPIVLISSQSIIIDSFRKLVRNCGLTDVIGRDSANLNQLLQELAKSNRLTNKSMRQHLTNEPLGKPIGSSTNQVSTNSQTAKPTGLPTVEQPPRPSKSESAQQPIDRSIAAKSSEKSKITGQCALAALEEIVTISNNFFGPLAQGNYWRKAHDLTVDQFPFVLNWSADHFSKLSCDDKIVDQELSAVDIESIQIWVQFFIEECERIIVDYQTILHSSDLSRLAKDLLPKL
jgi:hypothetical protein